MGKGDGYYNDLRSSEAFANRDRWTVRGQLLFEPSDTLRVRTIYDYGKRDESCCPATLKHSGATGAIITALGGIVTPENNEDDLDVGTNFDPFDRTTD